MERNSEANHNGVQFSRALVIQMCRANFNVPSKLRTFPESITVLFLLPPIFQSWKGGGGQEGVDHRDEVVRCDHGESVEWRGGKVMFRMSLHC